MATINATSARKDIYKLISDVNTNSDPVTITGKNGNNAVLISEADWKNIQETIYLNSISGLAESIIAGSKEPLRECKEYLEGEEW